MEKFKGSQGILSYERDGNSGFVVESTKVDEIATFWIDKEIDDSEAEYNAKLFIASKDLLEALQELIQVKEWKEKYGKDEQYLKAQPTAWSNAQKAIEKALT